MSRTEQLDLLQYLVRFVYVDSALPIGALTSSLKNLIDYTFSKNQHELMWDVLTDTLEARWFVKFLLRDYKEKIEKLGKAPYLEAHRRKA